MVTLRDKSFVPFLDEGQISEATTRLGKQISVDYEGLNPILIPVLNGSFMFSADLLRHVSIPCEITFIKVASYEFSSSKGEVEELLGLDKDIIGRHIIILEDIVDTGLTMHEVVRTLKELGPASVSIATLLLKPASMKASVEIRYRGFEIGPEFVVGYGMDYDGQGRNLPQIYVNRDLNPIEVR